MNILSKDIKFNNGYSILELTVVVVVLGILASVSLPRVSSFINSAKVDSAKAKLNAAAATCLQDIRQAADPSSTISAGTLSNELLESDGYKISSDMSSCSTLMIEPLNPKNAEFFPMGFSIADGRLTKFAVPLSEDSQQACKSWAGSNCKAGEELKNLIAHNKAVQEAKTTCNESFYSWLNGNPAGDGKKFRWDPKADNDCKRIPPANTGSTCTTNGCTLETWTFEGTIVNGEDGYKDALERKYGKICTEKLEEKLQNKYTGGPVSILECGSSKVMWFHEGVDVGSEQEMNNAICTAQQSLHQGNGTTGTTQIPACGDKDFYYCMGEDKNTEPLMQECIDSDAEASCKQDIKEAQESNHNGMFVPDKNGPGVCSTPIWICNGLQYSTEDAYSSSECNKADQCGEPLSQRCYEPSYRKSRRGRRVCEQWIECMGL